MYADLARSKFPSQTRKKNSGVRSTFGRSDVVLHGTCTLSKVGKNVESCSSFNYNLHYTTLNCTTLLCNTLHYTGLHYTTLHYTPLIATLHSLHYHKCDFKCTTLITPHHNYNSTTLPLQLQLHYTTLRPAVVGEVTTETIATTPKNTAPSTFRSIR